MLYSGHSYIPLPLGCAQRNPTPQIYTKQPQTVLKEIQLLNDAGELAFSHFPVGSQIVQFVCEAHDLDYFCLFFSRVVGFVVWNLSLSKKKNLTKQQIQKRKQNAKQTKTQ